MSAGAEIDFVAAQLDVDQVKVIEDILASANPEAMLALVALPWEVGGEPVAKYLLGDQNFEALLAVADKDMISRFSEYFK